MDLFTHTMNDRIRTEAPLAARYAWCSHGTRRTLDKYIGQEHILGPGGLLRWAIEADRMFPSIRLWGPPGTAKTMLAQMIANTTKSYFETLSTVLDGKADQREFIEQAQERRKL